MKGFENMVIQKDDMVFYQTNNEKAWLGYEKVTDIDKTGYLLLEMEILRSCQSLM